MSCHIFVYLFFALIQYVTSDVAPITDFVAYQSGKFGLRPNQTYHTSNITSPVFLVNTWDKASVDNASHIFLAYAGNPETGVGMFFSASDLSLVWFQDETRGNKVNHVGVQQFQGNDYLTVWVGKQTDGHANGKWLMLNSSYDIVHTITTNGLPIGADIHEFRLTNEGTALITAYNPIQYDLRTVGGSKWDTLLDGVFQEVDVITGRALFTWHTIDHFSIADSCVPYLRGPGGWDWCHINSIQKTLDGHYVVSLNFCRMVVYINGTNGNPIWIMGGKKNQFTNSTSGRVPDFAFQHHAVFHDKELKHLTMFDNHVRNSSLGCTFNCSTARFFTIDYATMSMSSVRQLSHPKGLQSMAMGNVESLPEGNTLVNWGYNAALTEHTAAGEVVLDLQFGVLGRALGSYRAYKKNWKGYPTTDPTIVVRRQNASSPEILYVSWNGATEVKCWGLLASASVNPLRRVTLVDAVLRAGFETAILVRSPERYIRAVGLDAQKEVLGMSSIWDRKTQSMVNIDNFWQFERKCPNFHSDQSMVATLQLGLVIVSENPSEWKSDV